MYKNHIIYETAGYIVFLPNLFNNSSQCQLATQEETTHFSSRVRSGPRTSKYSVEKIPTPSGFKPGSTCSKDEYKYATRRSNKT